LQNRLHDIRPIEFRLDQNCVEYALLARTACDLCSPLSCLDDCAACNDLSPLVVHVSRVHLDILNLGAKSDFLTWIGHIDILHAKGWHLLCLALAVNLFPHYFTHEGFSRSAAHLILSLTSESLYSCSSVCTIGPCVPDGHFGLPLYLFSDARCGVVLNLA